MKLSAAHLTIEGSMATQWIALCEVTPSASLLTPAKFLDIAVKNYSSVDRSYFFAFQKNCKFRKILFAMRKTFKGLSHSRPHPSTEHSVDFS